MVDFDCVGMESKLVKILREAIYVITKMFFFSVPSVLPRKLMWQPSCSVMLPHAKD
jgi:hypothetical protein